MPHAYRYCPGFFVFMMPASLISTLFPYTTLFRSVGQTKVGGIDFNKPRIRWVADAVLALSSVGGFTASQLAHQVDRKSTRLNSSHRTISYAVFCLTKKIKPLPLSSSR